MTDEIRELTPYLVQVLQPEGGETNGTGFFCHPEGYVLTCHHVITPYLAEGRETVVLIHAGRRYSAEICQDLACEAGDIAVLKLARLPENAGWLPVDVHDRKSRTKGDTLRSFGYPKGPFEHHGIAITGHLGGLTPTALDGVPALPIEGLRLLEVDGGYSGAPILDERIQKVIGLMHAKDHATQAFMVPIEAVFTTWPALREAHDVYHRIRESLAEQARRKLEEKLRGTDYIPLKLEAGRSAPPGAQGEEAVHGWEGQDREWEAFPIGGLSSPTGQYVLSSDVGTGKTTFLDWLTTTLVEKSERVPLLMASVDVEQGRIDSWEAFRSRVREALEPNFLAVDLDDFFDAYDEQQVFLLDALDQIREGHYSALFDRCVRIAGGNPILVASRPTAVLALMDRPDITFLRLKPFTPADQRHYFGEADYPKAERIAGFAPELTRVPMLAYMVRTLIRAGEAAGIATRTEMYQRFLRHILAVHEPNRPLYLERRTLSRKIEAALERISYEALAQESPQLQTIDEDFYYQNIDELPVEDTTRFGLVNLVVECGERHLIQFTHQSFQEFLAARYVAKDEVLLEKVLDERWNPKWLEVIKFLSGLTEGEVVSRIIAEPDNVIHANLFLAASCIREAKAVPEGLKDTIRRRLGDLVDVEPFSLGALVGLLEIGDTTAFRRRLQYADHQFRQFMLSFDRLCDLLDRASIEALAARLNDKDLMIREDRQLRRMAAFVLGGLGERLDRTLIEPVVAQLEDGDAFVRREAVEVLEALGEGLDRPLIERLTARLGDDDPEVREAATVAVSGLGERLDQDVIERLVAQLDDDNPGVRRTAVSALSTFDESLDHALIGTLAARLDDEDAEVRREAADALWRVCERLDDGLIMQLVARLDDEDQDVREAAVKALSALGERLDETLIRRLAARLDDDDSGVRSWTVNAMSGLAARLDDELIERLAERLDDDSPRVRSDAISVLSKLGDCLNDELIERLVGRLDDDDPLVRWSVFSALAGLGGRADDTLIERFAERLENDDPDVRQTAIRALGGVGDRLDVLLIERLAARLDDDVSEVRLAAVEALSNVGERLDRELIGRFAERLVDEEPDVRRSAIEGLARLSEQLDTALIEKLAMQLEDNEPEVREAAVEALAGLGDRLDTALMEKFVARLNDENPDVRWVVAEAFPAIDCLLTTETANKVAAYLTKGEEDMDPVYSVLESLYVAGVALPTHGGA